MEKQRLRKLQKGNRKWNLTFRLYRRDGDNILQKISQEATKNHNVKRKEELRKLPLTDNDFTDVLCIDEDRCFENLFHLHIANGHCSEKELYKKAKEMYDSNYGTNVCKALVSSCPVCCSKGKKRSKAVGTSTEVSGSVIAFSAVMIHQVNLPGTLIVYETKKQFFFLKPIFRWSFQHAGHLIRDITCITGVPNQIRYVPQNDLPFSDEELKVQKRLEPNEVETCIIASMNEGFGVKLCTTSYQKKRHGNVNNLSQAVKMIYSFYQHKASLNTLNKADYFGFYESLQKELPLLQFKMNEETSYPKHTKSDWLSKFENPFAQYQQELNPLNMFNVAIEQRKIASPQLDFTGINPMVASPQRNLTNFNPMVAPVPSSEKNGTLVPSSDKNGPHVPSSQKNGTPCPPSHKNGVDVVSNKSAANGNPVENVDNMNPTSSGTPAPPLPSSQEGGGPVPSSENNGTSDTSSGKNGTPNPPSKNADNNITPPPLSPSNRYNNDESRVSNVSR